MIILIETATGFDTLTLAPEFTSVAPGGGAGIYDPARHHPGKRTIVATVPPGDVITSADFAAGTYTTAPPPVHPSAVDAERDRRQYGGFTFNGNTFDSDPLSLTKISGAGTLAGFAVFAGAQPGDLLWHSTAANPTTNPFYWITADNQTVQMDAQTVFALGQAAANWVTLHTFTARAMKDAPPIPADYANNARWP